MSFFIRTKKGDYSMLEDKMKVAVVCYSVDEPYDSFKASFRLKVDQVPPPAPERPSVHRTKAHNTVIVVQWSIAQAVPADMVFELQWSEKDDFRGALNWTESKYLNKTLTVIEPLTLKVVYYRVRAKIRNGVPSEWSTVSRGWRVAKDCQFVGEYLVSSGNLEKYYHWQP